MALTPEDLTEIGKQIKGELQAFDVGLKVKTAVAETLSASFGEGLKTVLETPEKAAETLVATVKAAKKTERDDYRVLIHFFAGAIAVCIGLIGAVLTSLDSIAKAGDTGVLHMAGGVIAWTAITFFVLIVLISAAQIRKFLAERGQVRSRMSERERNIWARLMGIVGVLSFVTLLFAISGGYDLIAAHSAKGMDLAVFGILFSPF